jgi:hypothetical protein
MISSLKILLASNLIAALLFPIPVPATTHFQQKSKSDLIKLQATYFQAIKDGKYDVVSALLAIDYVGVYSDGIIDREHEIKDLHNFALTDYQVSNENVTFPNVRTGIVTFKLHVKVTVNGKDFTEDDNISCIWTKQNKKWLMSLQAAVKIRSASEIEPYSLHLRKWVQSFDLNLTKKGRKHAHAQADFGFYTHNSFYSCSLGKKQ